MNNYLELLNYRRQVADIYAQARRNEMSVQARWEYWRRERDALFASHSQSALAPDDRLRFNGLSYFPYNPDLRFLLELDSEVETEIFEIPLRDDGLVHMQRFAKIHFELQSNEYSLSLFWIMGYAGGVFLPFRDQTNDEETYGGGRYLLDTIKHADLGIEEGKLVIDFNFAYNPSCAYSPQWHCPLAPQENWLPVPIRAGEKKI